MARSGGFTLPEVMIAMTIMMVVIGGILSFYTQFYKIGFVNEQKNRINRDMRHLTGELSHAGRQSNYFIIYNSIAANDRDEAADRRLAGKSGDMLVFVYTEDGGSAFKPRVISKLVCYYRVPGADEAGVGPLRRYTKEFPEPIEVDFSAGSAEFEAILPSVEALKSGTQLVELAQGLINEQLFYNFSGRSVMVSGRIYHGNNAKRVTETYNLTISPRG